MGLTGEIDVLKSVRWPAGADGPPAGIPRALDGSQNCKPCLQQFVYLRIKTNNQTNLSCLSNKVFRSPATY